MSKNKRTKEESPDPIIKVPDARGAEDATFKDVGTRVTEHGEVKTEASRQDFINATSHELGEPGVPYRQPRSDTELLTDLIKTFEAPPPSPETVDPAILAIYDEWFEKDAPRSLHHPWGRNGIFNRNKLLQHIGVNHVTRQSLTAAANECRTLIFVPWSLDNVPQVPEKLPPVLKKKRGRPPKEKQAVVVLDDEPVRWLRRGIFNRKTGQVLTPRQVVRLMDDPNFNPAVVSTDRNAITEPKFAKQHEKILAAKGNVLPETFDRRMNNLMNSLPTKIQTLFTSSETQFYRDYASGNYSEDQLAERHSAAMVSSLIILENEIIKHLISLNLLTMPRRSRKVCLEENWQLENQAILSGAATIGGTIIGSKYKFGADRSFGQYGLNSFEIGSNTKFVRGGGSEENAGPAYEDNADDRDDYTPD